MKTEYGGLQTHCVIPPYVITDHSVSDTQNMRPHVKLHSREGVKGYAFHISKEREMTRMYEICCQTLSALCFPHSDCLFKHIMT
jgi:hypothetical protein